MEMVNFENLLEVKNIENSFLVRCHEFKVLIGDNRENCER